MGDVDAVLATGMGYAPIASGLREPRNYGTEGLPFAGSFGPLGHLAMAPGLGALMQGAGYMPFGLGHDQNLSDILRARQFYQQQSAAVSQAAMLDRRNYMRTMREMFHAAGVPFGFEQQRFAGTFSDLAVAGSPVLAMLAPDALDAMGGMRGSAAVMAHRIAETGRYRVDPVTGLAGYDARTTAAMSAQLYAGIADRGRHALSAGQIGTLFGELEHRGMLSGGLGLLRPLDRLTAAGLSPTELGAAAGRQGVVMPATGMRGLAPQDLDRVVSDPGVADRLRAVDSKQVQRSLEGYTKALSVIRDIFGDAGHPNAPMQELMSGLEALTNGATAQLDPNQLAQIASRTHTLAKNAGIGLGGVMAIQGNAAAQASHFGLSPMFAAMATQGSLAANQAFRQLGFGQGGGWGAFDANQFTQLDTNLRLGAAASSMSNRLALVQRLHEQVGFAAGSDAEALARAVSGGRETVTIGGRTRRITDLVQTDQGIADLLARGTGQSLSQIRGMLGQGDANNEFKSREVLNLVRFSQPQEVMNTVVRSGMAVELQNLLSGRVGDAKAREVAAAVSSRLSERILSRETSVTDRRQFQSDIGRLLEDELRQSGMGGMLDAMTPGDRSRFIATAASSLRGGSDRAIAQSQFSSFGNLFNLRRQGPEFADATRAAQGQSDADSAVSQALTGLTRGTFGRRLFDAMQNVDLSKPGGVREALAKAAGGVSVEDVSEAMVSPLMNAENLRRRAASLRSQMAGASPAERERLQGDFERVTNELREQVDALSGTMRQTGALGPAGLSASALAGGARDQRALFGFTLDAAAISGGFGHEVDDREAREAAMNYRTSRPRDREGLTRSIIARRRAMLRSNAWRSNPEFLAKLRRENPHATEAELLQMARSEAERLVDRVGDADLAAELADPDPLKKLDPSEWANFGRELVSIRRGLVPIRATEAQVDALMASQPGVTRDSARFQADALQRAARYGISQREIAAEAARGGGSHADAAYRLMQQRDEKQYDVSPAEIAEFKRNVPDPNMTDDMARASVLMRRHSEKRARFDQLLRSDDAQIARDVLDRTNDQIEGVIAGSASPDAVKIYGGSVLEAAKKLRGIQARRRQIADTYGGGDALRVLYRDFDYDPRNVAERTRIGKIKGELDVMDAEVAGILSGLKPGMRLGDVSEAARQLGAEGDSRFRGADAALLQKLTTTPVDQLAGGEAEMAKSLLARRQAMGDRAEAKFLAGEGAGDGTLQQMAAKVGLYRKMGPEGLFKAHELVRRREGLDKAAQELSVSRSYLSGVLSGQTQDAALLSRIGDRVGNLRQVAADTAKMEAELPAGWEAGLEVEKLYEKRSQEAAGEFDTKKALSDVLALHGIDRGSVADRADLATRFERGEGRHQLEAWKRSAERIAKRAAHAGISGDVIGQIETEWAQAHGRDEAGFRRKFGITSDDEMLQMREDLATQRTLRKDVRGNELERLGGIAKNMEGQASRAQSVEVRFPESVKLMLGGSVKIDREGNLTPDGATMGQMQFPVPQGAR